MDPKRGGLGPVAGDAAAAVVPSRRSEPVDSAAVGGTGGVATWGSPKCVAGINSYDRSSLDPTEANFPKSLVGCGLSATQRSNLSNSIIPRKLRPTAFW